MEATLLMSSSWVTASALRPQNLDHRGAFSLTIKPQRCGIAVVCKKLSFCTKVAQRGNVQARGVPTSVPVRVAHELHQAGHRYLDVRTPDEFNAGHALGAINIPYFYKAGSGMTKNPHFLAEVSSHFGKYDEIIVGCQLGKWSLMAATDLLSASQTLLEAMRPGLGASFLQNEDPAGSGDSSYDHKRNKRVESLLLSREFEGLKLKVGWAVESFKRTESRGGPRYSSSHVLSL
ncbi:hypothetical protein PTKIN_Ptkin07bG0309400 [Pterospermum kingtungense]